MPILPPLALYIHFPWCLRKCPYCDFNSHEFQGDVSVIQHAYVQALVSHLNGLSPLIAGRLVYSIFIGGGTPSLIAPQALKQLLEQVKHSIQMAPGCEVTLEANPGTFEAQRFSAFREAGVTRLSLGIQSFNDDKLKALGRIHNAKQARRAIEEARLVFNTFNLDLMYALPGQSLDELKRDLEAALAYEPPHMSLYHLTLEPNTYFAKYPPDVPDDDMASQMLDVIAGYTQCAGLKRYEVSAYARDGHQCLHNRNYWEFGDYLGIGAGAHGKLTAYDGVSLRVSRHVQHRDPTLYMKKVHEGCQFAQWHDVPALELPFEFMLGALRLKEGVSPHLFVQRTGLPLSAVEKTLHRAVSMGLLKTHRQAIRPTAKGFDFLSDLQELFLP